MDHIAFHLEHAADTLTVRPHNDQPGWWVAEVQLPRYESGVGYTPQQAIAALDAHLAAS